MTHYLHYPRSASTCLVVTSLDPVANTHSNIKGNMLCRLLVMMLLHLTALVVGCCQWRGRTFGIVSGCNTQAIFGTIFRKEGAC